MESKKRSRSIAAWRCRGWRQLVVLYALLVLPGCNQIFGLKPTVLAPNLDAGGVPRNYAVFCDVESRVLPRRCATADEVASGLYIPQSSAAVAFSIRATSTASLDYSDAARLACGGLPELVTYEGPYPEGIPVCVKAIDVLGSGGFHPTADDVCFAYCQDNDDTCQSARGSTNYPQTAAEITLFGFGGFLGACTREGVLLPEYDTTEPGSPFIDPRRVSTAVVWDTASLMGVAVTGSAANNLIRTTPGGNYTASATSFELFRRGDGFVEFTATERNRKRILGLSEGAAPNTQPGASHIEFGIELGSDGIARVLESGSVKATLGPYAVSGPQTFRIRLTDRNAPGDRATVAYATLLSPCDPGTACAENVLYTHTGSPSYPFHIDTAFADENATLTNVRILRIK